MWFTHFQNLLGNPPSTDMEESELIPAIISDLDINEAYNSVPMLRFFINPQMTRTELVPPCKSLVVDFVLYRKTSDFIKVLLQKRFLREH